MRRILVTGTSGFLGHYVVEELRSNPDFEVIAIGGRSKDQSNTLPQNERLSFYSLDGLFINEFKGIDTVINCAFARSNDAGLLAQAFDFTEQLIWRLEELRVRSVINISSQGVYQRLPKGELSTEDSPIEPVDLYSMAKYATEKLFSVSSIPYVTNIRLASLMMPQRFLSFFVRKAMRDEPFTVTAPHQYAALLDVKDAASGLVAITNIPPDKRAKVYNLGIGTQYSLLEYALSVKEVGSKLGHHVTFEIADNKTESNSGMDCSRLMDDSGWKPTVFLNEMVSALFKDAELGL